MLKQKCAFALPCLQVELAKVAMFNISQQKVDLPAIFPLIKAVFVIKIGICDKDQMTTNKSYLCF